MIPLTQPLTPFEAKQLRILARRQQHHVGPGVRFTVEPRMVWPRLNGTLTHAVEPRHWTREYRHQVEMKLRRSRQLGRTAHEL